MSFRILALFSLVSTTLMAQTPPPVNTINLTTSTVNRDIVVNDNENTCTFDQQYNTPLDCAFARARYLVAHTGLPQTVRAGSGIYQTITGLQVTAANGIAINFHGAAKSSFKGGTTIQLANPLPSGTPVINVPYLMNVNNNPQYWSNITWTDVTIDANGNADMCWDFEAPRDGYFARLGCRNAVGGRAHWRIGGYSTQYNGLVPPGNTGTGFQTTVDDIFDSKDAAKGPGATIASIC